jgi:DNA mismatch repair ATPase MutS
MSIAVIPSKATDTRLVFDYKIKPGILKNKNGIAIMAAMGYPENVVANANKISLALKEKYNL